MPRKVVITGAGVISSLADSPAGLHAALCEGRSGLRPVTAFPTDGVACRVCAPVEPFAEKTYFGPKNLRPLDRTSRLVAAAARLALDASGWSAAQMSQHDLGLVLGTMFCSVRTIAEFDRRALTAGPEYASPMDFANTVINAAAGQTAIWHGLRGINSTIAAGLASGLQAIGYATELIRNGRAHTLLAGGGDEFCFESFYGFARAGLLCAAGEDHPELPVPFHARRNGLALGEGAALLVLEDAEFAAARGATVFAEVRGHGSAYDCSRGQDREQAFQTVARAVRLGLQDARAALEEIDCLSASANGSVEGDSCEARGVASALDGAAASLPVTAIKSMLGETLGASGALQTVALIEAMRDGVLPGIQQLDQTDAGFPLPMAGPENRTLAMRTGLITSLGLDGNCCSLVVGRAA